MCAESAHQPAGGGVERSVFINMKNLAPVRDGRVSLPDFEKMQDHMIKLGFVEKKIDVSKIVDLSYLPGK